ncbi:ESPR-type extended signal peptide-containing protein, partial [Achromobacter xylosoxidans]
MNRIYRLVWNAVSQSWVPVSEAARARGKSRASRVGAIAGVALLLSATEMFFPEVAVAQGLQLCRGVGDSQGRSYGYGSNVTLNCGVPTQFSLNNVGTENGGAGFGASTTYVRGMRDDGTLRLAGQNGIQMRSRVDMLNNVIDGVAAGTLSATSTQAVNGSQLFVTNTSVTANTAAIGQNASAITGLGTRMTATEGNVTGLGTRITSAEGNLTTQGARITQNTTNLSTLTTQINNGAVGLVRQDATTNAVTVAAGTGGTSVSMAGTGGSRTVSGVSAGALNASSTDAVNGGQLFTTNANVSANTNAIARNTADIASSNTAITNVANRTTAVEGNVTNLTTQVNQTNSAVSNLTTQVNNGAVGLVRQDATTNAVTVAGTTGGTSVSMAGTAGARTVSGVNAGAVAATSTDAVNGGQLFATNTNVSANTSAITRNTADIAGNRTAIADVANRTTTVEGNVTNLTTQINNGGVGLVRQDATTNAVTVAGTTGGTSVS